MKKRIISLFLVFIFIFGVSFAVFASATVVLHEGIVAHYQRWIPLVRTTTFAHHTEAFFSGLAWHV